METIAVKMSLYSDINFDSPWLQLFAEIRKKKLNFGVPSKTARKIGKKGTNLNKCYIFFVKEKRGMTSSILFFFF